MSLLHPHLFNAFLDEYVNEREPEWGSMYGYLKRLFNDVTEKRKEICDQLKSDFEISRLDEHNFKELKLKKSQQEESGEISEEEMPTDDAGEMTEEKIVDKWITILYKLGTLAREAQNTRVAFPTWFTWLPEKIQSLFKDSITYNDSRFFRTLHAIRTLIIYLIIHDQKFGLIFEKKIAALEHTKKELVTHIRSVEAQGFNIEGLLKDLKVITIQLADLNHMDSILDAKKDGYFGDIQYPNREDKKFFKEHKININTNVPWCYQNGFFRAFYMTVFQPNTKLDLTTFLNTALKTDKSVNESVNENECVILNRVLDITHTIVYDSDEEAEQENDLEKELVVDQGLKVEVINSGGEKETENGKDPVMLSSPRKLTPSEEKGYLTISDNKGEIGNTPDEVKSQQTLQTDPPPTQPGTTDGTTEVAAPPSTTTTATKQTKPSTPAKPNGGQQGKKKRGGFTNLFSTQNSTPKAPASTDPQAEQHKSRTLSPSPTTKD